MQQLIDMLRTMAASCRQIALTHPTGTAHAVQAVSTGVLPGIRAGLGNGIMVRVIIERENNDSNAEAATAENAAWNTLWVDPERDR
jgi:LytS/YehU family sensor histidine kinase